MLHRSYKLLLVFLLTTTSMPALADSRAEIDANVQVALQEFYEKSPAGKILAQDAAGMLVFPRVLKAGLGVGGEYGEGSLLIGGQPAAYYSTASASIGFQFGAQLKSQVVLFMTRESLDRFRDSDGWEAGVDGSIALIEFGAAEEISSNSIQDPIVGFIFSNRGFMYNLTFEGSKMTEIVR
jgi:lipid-binding SYLF domain-containing protein